MIEYVTRGEWYDGEIRRFVRIDNENPPRKRGVLFVGSSIFREWREARDFAADVAPLGADCLNRAFGGSTTRDQLDVMEQIVFPHDPKVLVYYCGSNDVNAGVPPRVIRDNFLEWCARAFSRCPSARRILFVSIMRAPQKAPVWDALDEANALIREACGEEGEEGRRGLKRVSFVDVNPLLRDASTLEPLAQLYRDDGLHFHPSSYDRFAPAIVDAARRALDECGDSVGRGGTGVRGGESSEAPYDPALPPSLGR
ncbi:predicted protein [Micromonas commoda]|uniref:SGNH hydrolase-type esterase domain-containing protein n=1 Tax=Micromonas commoda (strain RCC299 / NOUM17 / CCMP2709) TaxID=296587 RepID=C1E0Y5_MICCC|nr:predicted protein [Micromonas commoda]ACO61637.1 predicted protein [Micromonas commoda]|eukprot:XP_002500379.1 predicted protein [Micromonas commoda]